MSPPCDAFAVVSTVSEPDPLVLAFVAHWLAEGAQAVHLFLDRPQPSLEGRLAAVPAVRVTVCDAARWAGHPGGRPPAQNGRQKANLQAALDTLDVPWVVHVDADEFHLGPPLGEALAALDPAVDAALIGVAERVFVDPPDPRSILSGAFRRPAPPRLRARVEALDGPLAPFLDRGMTAFASGKSAFRTGRGLVAGIHGPLGRDPERGARLAGHALLHFDGLTARSWVRKKRRTIAQQPDWPTFPARHRVAQFRAVAEGPADGAEGEALFLALRRLEPGRAAGLRDLGLLIETGPDTGPDLAAPGLALFPGLDLSVGTFDAHELAWTPRRDLAALRRRVVGALRRLRR